MTSYFIVYRSKNVVRPNLKLCIMHGECIIRVKNSVKYLSDVHHYQPTFNPLVFQRLKETKLFSLNLHTSFG